MAHMMTRMAHMMTRMTHMMTRWLAVCQDPLFIQYVHEVLNFLIYSEEEIVWCGNLSLLNETSSAELSHVDTWCF